MLNILVASVARAGGIEVPLTPTVVAPRPPGLFRRTAKALVDFGRAIIRAQTRRPISHRALPAVDGATSYAAPWPARAKPGRAAPAQNDDRAPLKAA